MQFSEDNIFRVMETMRGSNGGFIAAPTNDYRALWLRDTLYCTYSYWYLGEYEKLKEGIWVAFSIFKKYRDKIKTRIASPTDLMGAVLHAKYHRDTLEEITADNGWGHHQLDAIGLFLYIVADLDFKNIRTIRDDDDVCTIELLVGFLRSVEYWKEPDFGMWEECKIRHASSIGAVVAGLTRIRNRRIVRVPDPLISAGEHTLRNILPYESRDACRAPHHRHDCDSSLLALVWPYNVIVNPAKTDELLGRLLGGHIHENGERHCLVQRHGLNRYWGDDYYRSMEPPYHGISAEWPMFFFWVSIIYSQRHDYEKAALWFEKGAATVKDNVIPEAYQNGRPNDHAPLAWAHAIALIAWSKLPDDLKSRFQGR